MLQWVCELFVFHTELFVLYLEIAELLLMTFLSIKYVLIILNVAV